jgi:hypothetical protein
MSGIACDTLDLALARLHQALERDRTEAHCLRLWSRFVRLRDGGRCVICEDQQRIAAHHIVRKSFLPQARFETGNGITLCRVCHAEPHAAFNGRPDMTLPMDFEGGESIDLMISLFGHLSSDARSRGLLCDQYYFVSDGALRTYKNFQGISTDINFPGVRLEQADLIWRQTPRSTLSVLAKAFGFELPSNFIQLGPFTAFDSEGAVINIEGVPEKV